MAYSSSKEYKREWARKYRLEHPDRLRESKNRYYQKNRERVLAGFKERKSRLVGQVQQIKADAGCKVCGEHDPRCLDFHHRDPESKSFCISTMVCLKRWSLDRLRGEIAKCDVVCRNCHAKLTFVDHAKLWRQG